YGYGDRSTNVDIAAGNDTPIVRFGGITNGTILGNAGAYPINRDQTDQQLVYNISSSSFARHTLRGGLDLRRSKLNDRASNNNRGFWNFTAACGGVTYPTGFHAFMAGCVATYQKSFGPDYLENEIDENNFYVQDDWRPWDNLTLNLGVRYEMAGAPKEKENRIDYFFDDNTYVDPRLGFAYTPNWDGNRFFRAITGGNGKFSIRGGYGHYHGRVFQSIFSQGGANVRYNPPNATALSITAGTNISDPTNGFVFVPGQPLTTRVALTLIDEDLQMPETRQWNLTFERQVLSSAKVRASYIGTLGKGLLQYRFDNLPVRPGAPGSGATWVIAADAACAGTGLAGAPRNAACPNDVPIAANEVSLRFPRTNERRPDARYTTNLIVDNIAESSYHAGQLEFETGLVHGFQGRVTYTYSKAIDSGSEATASGTGDINIFPPEYDDYKRGLSRFDTRHRVTMTGSYLLPFFRDTNDWRESVLGGWQISTVIRASSGTPFTIIDGGAVDIDFDGVANQRPVVVRSNYAGGWHVNNPNTSTSELPANAFRRATPSDTIDDLVGRNTYFTDGVENVDFGLYKTFKVPFNNDSLVVRLD
ncbi:MAG TPA: TonB-dependent receptor, partial [Thermoanaerobaculia bacterium]